MSELPAEWVVANLLEATRPTGVSINPTNFADERFTLYSVPSFDSRTPEEVCGFEIGSNKQIVSAGTLLVCKINPRINRIWIVDNHQSRILASTEWIALEVQPQIDGKYVAFYLQNEHVRQHLAENASGVGGSLMRVRPAILGSLTLPIPPLAEQHRIVAEIEKQFTRLAAAEALVSAARGKVLALWGRIIGRLFEATPESEWRSLELLIADGPQNGLYKPAQAYGEGIPIVRIDDISSSGDIRSREALRFLSVTDEELGRYELRPNDVLINRVNSMSHLGKSAVVPHDLCPAVFESNMMRLRLTSDILPMWVTCYLNSRNGRRRLTANAKHAVNQASINQKDVCNTSVPCPSTEVQSGKLEYLSDVDSTFRATVAAAQLLTRRASRLRQSILAKAFSGQLVPQDPDDEPASVLLERIRADRQYSTHGCGKPRRVRSRTREAALQSG